jgi:D-glycero-alpha-D-manno-heptose 1-phosphate guanylyltransferase
MGPHVSTKNLADITAVILAGGLGTRLRPVVSDRPKVLAVIRGRPFITYLLDQLASAGIQSVVLCTGYQGELVKASLGDSYRTIELIYSQEPSPLGTGGALRQALPLFQTDPALVLNGDSFCDLNLSGFFQWHETHEARATLALVQMPKTQRYGRVDLGPDGDVIRFNEKGTESGAGWINAGIYLLTRPLLQAIPKEGPVSLERDLFPAWMGRGLYGYPGEGRFLDIGTPESYAIADEFFALGRV